LERDFFQTVFVEKIKTHFVFSNFFLNKIVPLRDKVEKFCTSGQTTDDTMAHAHCMMGN